MKFRLIQLITLTFLFASQARADLVLLEDGDRISGRVQSLSDGVLKLKTAYGPLQLPWNRIVELRTDSPVQLTLKGGERVSGVLQLRNGQLLFPQSPSLSQLTVPADSVAGLAPADAPAVRLEGRVSAGANVARGNTEAQTYHLDAEFIARTALNRYTLAALGNYGTDGDEQILGDASLQARYDHFFEDRWYFNSNFGVLHDEFRDLDLRTTVGAGLGYQFWEVLDSRLSAELGISYIHENFDEAPDEGQPAARWGLDFRKKFSDLGLVFVHRHEVFFGLEDVEDVLLRSQSGVRMPLFGSVSGGLDVNLDYDWQPPADAEKADVIYLLKLIYEI